MSTAVDLKSILIKAFGTGELSRDGINYSVRCPDCKDSRREKRKLAVRLDDARYHCWVCGIKGTNVRRLIAKYRPDLVDKIENVRFFKNENQEIQEETMLSLPKGSQLLGACKLLDPDIKATFKYLQKRGLAKSDILRWRILVCPVGEFRRKVIIPSFDIEGNINYYVARTIDNHNKIKYRNAKVSKEKVIFNEIDLRWDQEMNLVEGVFDAIKCPENTVPILGSSLPKRSRLYQMIAKHQTSCIVSLDPDLKTKAFKIAHLLHSAGCDVKVAFADEGRDLGDLNKGKARSILSCAQPYSNMMRISHKISALRTGSTL